MEIYLYEVIYLNNDKELREKVVKEIDRLKSAQTYTFKSYNKMKPKDIALAKNRDGSLKAVIVVRDAGSDLVSPDVLSNSAYIIGKIKAKNYTDSIELEARRARLEAELDKAYKEAEKIAKYKALANMSPELAKLVDEYQNINKNLLGVNDDDK